MPLPDKAQRVANIPTVTRSSTTDFSVQNEGSIFLLHPHTEAAREWVNDRIGKDNGYQPYWPTVVVEHRYILSIVDAVREEGFTVV